MIYTVTLNPALDRTLTVKTLEFNQVIRAINVNLDWGGKGFNVSRALKQLGGTSTALGFIAGAAGNVLQEGINALQIPTDFVYTDGETRTNIVIVEESSARHFKVNEPGPIVCQEDQRKLLRKVQDLAKKGDLWALCGSLPPGIQPTYFADMIRIIHQAGGLTFLDSSEEALVQGLSAQPFLIKPNREEAEAVLGFRITNRYDLKEAANRFHALGIQRVAISCASEGLLLSQNGTTVIAPAPSITVANSVGAGDALLAGLLWAFTNGMNQKESAAWGVATGSAAVQMEGVNFAAYPVVENIFSFVIKNIAIL